MARALWKGAISFGLVHIPVELHKAVESHDLDLTMLDKRDFSPIGFKRYNKGSGKEVTWDQALNSKIDTFPTKLDFDEKYPTPDVPMPGKYKLAPEEAAPGKKS